MIAPVLVTTSPAFPNFLLNKLLKKTSVHQIGKTTSPVEQLQPSLQQGYEVSVEELDGLLSLLADKKRKIEQEEADSNMMVLLEFLHCLRKQKVEELNEVRGSILVASSPEILTRVKMRWPSLPTVLQDSLNHFLRPSLSWGRNSCTCLFVAAAGVTLCTNEAIQEQVVWLNFGSAF